MIDVKLSLQYASKIKSLSKHPTHDAVFDNRYMKLFDARPNASSTFGLRIKQFLSASNNDFFRRLEKPSHFVLRPWYIRPAKIVLDLMHLKKDRLDASIYQKLFMEIRERYRIIFLFIQMVHGIGILWLVLQVFHQTL